MIKDEFLYTQNSVYRLFSNYIQHNNLLVAYDFDNTVYDYQQEGNTFPRLEAILHECKILKFTLILFTAREENQLIFAIEYCKDHGYEPDYVNESPVTMSRKPYYNILLDDRAGLSEAHFILSETIKLIKEYNSLAIVDKSEYVKHIFKKITRNFTDSNAT